MHVRAPPTRTAVTTSGTADGRANHPRLTRRICPERTARSTSAARTPAPISSARDATPARPARTLRRIDIPRGWLFRRHPRPMNAGSVDWITAAAQRRRRRDALCCASFQARATALCTRRAGVLNKGPPGAVDHHGGARGSARTRRGRKRFLPGRLFRLRRPRTALRTRRAAQPEKRIRRAVECHGGAAARAHALADGSHGWATNTLLRSTRPLPTRMIPRAGFQAEAATGCTVHAQGGST